jgi:hypothetical protein
MAELNSEDSEPKPLKLGTDCKECIFFENSNECRLGKLDKFKNQGVLIEDFDDKYMIDRVCNFRRIPEWRASKSMQECMSIATDEVKIRGTIVITAKNIDDLDKCVSKLSKAKLVENFSIIICHHSDFKVKEVHEYINAQDYFNKIIGIRINEVSTHKGEIHFLDEAIKRSLNGFIFHIDSAKEFDINILDKINHYLYNEMGRLVYVPPDENEGVLVVMAVIYQMLKGNKFYDFQKKLKTLSEHQNISSQIVTWDDINEKYNG